VIKSKLANAIANTSNGTHAWALATTIGTGLVGGVRWGLSAGLLTYVGSYFLEGFWPAFWGGYSGQAASTQTDPTQVTRAPIDVYDRDPKTLNPGDTVMWKKSDNTLKTRFREVMSPQDGAGKVKVKQIKGTWWNSEHNVDRSDLRYVPHHIGGQIFWLINASREPICCQVASYNPDIQLEGTSQATVQVRALDLRELGQGRVQPCTGSDAFQATVPIHHLYWVKAQCTPPPGTPAEWGRLNT